MRYVVLIIATALSAHAQAEPPAIFQNGVFNSASRFPRSIPGGAVAHGARFTIQGVRLGSAQLTKVEVRAGARTYSPKLLSVSASAIEALLPATVPPGDANVVVIVNGKASAPQSIRVMASAPGLYSSNQLGWGAIPQTSSAAPGQTIALATTGAGGRIPEVVVGGRSVRAVLRPKAGSPGIDELVFALPRDVPAGCHVPVYAKSGEVVSNVVSIRVIRNTSAKGAACLPSVWPSIPGSTATIVLYQMAVTLETSRGDPQSGVEEEAAAAFSAPGSSVPPIRALPPPGTCMGVSGTYQQGEGWGILFGLNLKLPGMRPLDAGPQIEVSGNGGIRKLTARSPGVFSQSLIPRRDRRADTPAFLSPGEYSIAGSGGTDLGAFRTLLRVATPLVWIDRERMAQVDRSRGMTLTWAGHDPRQPVVVIAFSVDRLSTAYYSTLCVAAPGAAQFTIPPAQMSNLPATDEATGLPHSYLAVVQSPTGSLSEIRAPGISGSAIFFGGGARSIVFQ